MCEREHENGASRIRTENQGIMSPPITNPNSLLIQDVTSNTNAGRSAGCSGERAEGGITDPDLAALVKAWPLFSEPIKAAIRALVQSAKTTG